MQSVELEDHSLIVADGARALAEDDSAIEFYKQAFGGAWMTQAIGVAAEIGIADLLTEAPLNAEELAAKTNTSAKALYRLLRALAGVGVFYEHDDGRFALTPRGSMLRSDIPGSQRAFARLMSGEIHEAWGELYHSVKSGESGFDKRFGLPIFEYLVENPERHAVFDAGMTSIHDPETLPVVEAYDWSDVSHVVDVGGGNGLSLVTLLMNEKHLMGTVFEMPTVAARARATVREYGLSDRCGVSSGDFFTTVPPGADAYMLRHILHDWDDDHAVAILRICREAMAREGRILIVESVIPGPNEPHFGKWLDLMMLLIGGKERTSDEYAKLFDRAGLKLNRVIPTTSDVSIVEAVRAS